jgi:hypothetical protein
VTTAPARPTARLAVLAVTGVLLILPRLILAWFVGVDGPQFAASFLMIAGLVMLGIALFRLLLARRPTRPLWPLATAGIAGVLVAGLVTPLLKSTPIAYRGGIVPVPVVLFQYGWTLVGAIWVIGLVFAMGSAVVALQRR